MIIKKILNNNVIVTEDEEQHEVIVMGLGIGFQKKVGLEIDESKIDKIFKIQEKETKNAIDILESVPVEFLEISTKIISFAKTLVGKPMDDIIFVSLADHIHSSLERYKEGVVLRNALLWDIKQFYKEEYKIGLYAIDLLNEKFDVELLEDEAGFIALHFVNAQLEESVESTMQLTEIIQDITNIIKYNFQVEIDEDSVYYYRYINHIKSFAQRLLNNKTYDTDEDLEILDLIKAKYSNAYACAMKVGNYIQNKFNYTISMEEMVYLTVHIQRLVYLK